MDTNITTTFLFVVAMLTPQNFKKELLIELQTSSDGNVTLEKEVAANICGAMAFGCLVSAAITVFLVTKTKKYSRSEAEKGATKDYRRWYQKYCKSVQKPECEAIGKIDEWMIPPPATPARYQKWTIVGV
ncbi:hypothetical protein Tco_0837455 [Tanacetum coccineum]